MKCDYDNNCDYDLNSAVIIISLVLTNFATLTTLTRGLLFKTFFAGKIISYFYFCQLSLMDRFQ